MSLLRALGSFWRGLQGRYGTADPRSLGLFRIALGSLLFVDVARRGPDLVQHYTNLGWLPNHFMLYRPMSDHLFSVYLAFSTPEEVWVLFGFHLLVNACLILGYRTKLMQVLAAVLITSMNSRNILLENGGWVVLNLLSVWSAFLPIGRRYSVDAFLRSWRARREPDAAALNDLSRSTHDTRPVVSLAVTALILQWVVIYFFNVVHKSGLPWRDGTAVYYFFQQDRMVTLLGAWLRGVLPLEAIKLMTWSTLVIESSIFVLLVLPVFTGLARKLAWLLVCALHLSIDAVVQLGPFSWCMVIMFFALVPDAADWTRIDARLRKKRELRRVLFDPASGFDVSVCRVLRRFDSLGKLEYVAVDSHAQLPDSVSPELFERAFVVTDARGENVWTGRRALRRLADALPAPRPLVALAALVLGGWLDRAHALRVARSVRFGVDDLPSQLDEPRLESEAHRFFAYARHWFAQALVLLVLIACGSQVLDENHAVPAWLKPRHRPEWMISVVVYPRLFQGWSMFAPAPPADDGRLVIEGRTIDGRRIDPLTGTTPSFEVQPKNGYRMNQIWGDFHRRIAEARFSQYLPGVRDMLVHYHEITGRPKDRLVSFEVWHVNEHIPPPGHSKEEPSRRKILSWP